MADVLLASDRASFANRRSGWVSSPRSATALAARIGVARALEITSTGRTYPAAEMLRLGLVSRIVPPEGLAAALGAVLDDLRRASPAVMRMNVRLTRQLQGHPFEAARREAEGVFLRELMALEDVREGIASFYEKRRPVWKNR
jgi:enoyl-CoA hydratase/carnithine racemase